MRLPSTNSAARSSPLVCAPAAAGTPTLALGRAPQAAAASAAPILLTEVDARRAGLAVLARRATPRPFVALAQELADQRTPIDTFVELAPGLRLIAAHPQAAPTIESEVLG